MTEQPFDPRKLHQQITDAFDEANLRTICYYLGIDFEELAGDRKSEIVTDLLIQVENRGLLPKFLEILKLERPLIDWPEAPEKGRETEPAPEEPDKKEGEPDLSIPTTSKPIIKGDDGLFWTAPYGEPLWVEIPAGEFWMGNDDRRDNEKPLHRVGLASFLIAPVPITNAQYYLFTQAIGHRTPDHWSRDEIPEGLELHPVVYVNIRDAEAYCRWLSQVTNKQVALPDEAQWEKAARGPDDRRNYPWGDSFDPARCNTRESGIGTTTAVGQFADGASPYQLLDMCGNVWEWTRLPLISYPYRPDSKDEEGDDSFRVKRGGSYASVSDTARCSHRTWDYLDTRSENDGFRVVVLS